MPCFMKSFFDMVRGWTQLKGWKDLLLELGIITSHPGFTSYTGREWREQKPEKNALTK